MTPTEDPHPEHAKEKMDLLIALAKANDCIAALEAENEECDKCFWKTRAVEAESALAAARRENTELREVICEAASVSETVGHYDGCRKIRALRDRWERETAALRGGEEG